MDEIAQKQFRKEGRVRITISLNPAEYTEALGISKKISELEKTEALPTESRFWKLLLKKMELYFSHREKVYIDYLAEKQKLQKKKEKWGFRE